MSNSASCANAARQLGDLLAQLPIGDDTESWAKVEITAQGLANGLRVRNGEYFVSTSAVDRSVCFYTLLMTFCFQTTTTRR